MTEENGAEFGVVWKLIATGGALAGTLVTRKAVGSIWKATTGGSPPEHPENPDTTWAQALAWAMLTGAVAGAVRLLITRKAASSWRAATGQLPPGVSTG